MNNMTALISCYSRAYHYINNKPNIYSDKYARKLLSDLEYENISKNMQEGINYFNPEFKGTKEESLKWIVDNQLSPSVLGRSAFTSNCLSLAKKIGCKQYLVFASGYDTSSIDSDIVSFEIDKKEIIEDKINRLSSADIKHSINFIMTDFTKEDWINDILNSNYDKTQISFCSLLGISYYLTKDEFNNMLKNISSIIPDGSGIIFDYPTIEESKETKTNEELATASNEKMKSKYSYQDIENMLSNNGLLIYEHLDHNEMNETYFKDYNLLNKNKIYAPIGVNYCLAVKKTFYNS